MIVWLLKYQHQSVPSNECTIKYLIMRANHYAYVNHA